MDNFQLTLQAQNKANKEKQIVSTEMWSFLFSLTELTCWVSHVSKLTVISCNKPLYVAMGFLRLIKYNVFQTLDESDDEDVLAISDTSGRNLITRLLFVYLHTDIYLH